MKAVLTNSEAYLLVAFLVLLGFAIGGPPLMPFARIHEFADTRTLWRVPNALDVISGAAFAVAGASGLWHLAKAPSRALTNMQRAMSVLFFSGLLLLSAGSALYHLAPNNAVLAVQRYCLAPVIAGLIGLAVAGRVSERAAAAIGMSGLFLGLGAAKVCLVYGNMLPWAVFQYGGLLILASVACMQPLLRALPVSWAMVLVTYGAAKFLEMHDGRIFELTGHLVSGHTLKHLVAAMAAWPVISAIAAESRRHRKARDPGIADDVAIRWSNA